MLSVELKQERADKIKELRSIQKGAEGRKLTEEERKKVEATMARANELKTEIAAAELVEEEEQRTAEEEAKKRSKKDKKPGGEKREKREIISDYRFLNAIRSMLPNGPKLEGLEKEMHEEALQEAKRSGTALEGVGVPSFFVDFEKRDLVVGTDAAGGYTVPTILDGFIGPLRPMLKVRELGATVLTGLNGNLDIPKQTGVTSATWEGEQDENAESDPTFGKVSMTPKRLGALTEVGKQLLFQSSLAVEQLVRNDLSIAVQTALDSAAINGSGTAPIPEGILNTTGIGSVAIGTNGGAPLRSHLIDLWKEIAVDNADQGALAFLTTPGVKAKLMNTLLDSGSGRFVWEENSSLVGYRAETSTQVPSNLTKGTGTNLHAIIFGYWRDLMIGQWNGIDMVIDPYTKATTATVRLVINSWWDLAVRHAESFAAIVDADIT